MFIEFSTTNKNDAKRYLESPYYSGLTQAQIHLILENLEYGVRVRDPMMYGQASCVTISCCYDYSFECKDCHHHFVKRTPVELLGYTNPSSFQDTNYPNCPACNSVSIGLKSKVKLDALLAELEEKIYGSNFQIAKERLDHPGFGYWSEKQKAAILKFYKFIVLNDPSLVKEPTIRIQGNDADYIHNEIVFADHSEDERISSFSRSNYSAQRECEKAYEGMTLSSGFFKSYLKDALRFTLSYPREPQKILAELDKRVNKKGLIIKDKSIEFPNFNLSFNATKEEIMTAYEWMSSRRLLSPYFELLKKDGSGEISIGASFDMERKFNEYCKKNSRSLSEFSTVYFAIKEFANWEINNEKRTENYRKFIELHRS